MTALTFEQTKALKVGDRVAFPDGADAYPHFMFDERLTGTVNEVDTDMICVVLDVYKPELDDWDNQLQLILWDEETAVTHGVERLLSAGDAYGTAPSTLDAFVQTYCAARNLPVDGDVFGIVFSGAQADWTTSEAAAIIEDAVGIYGLRA